MIELSVPDLIRGNESKYIKECLDTNWVSSAGRFVKEFELAISGYVKAKAATCCVNGTCGLFLALKLCGVGPGDEVLVPTLTFIASANAVKHLGAEPVFMDCDEFMNLNPDKLAAFCADECRLAGSGLKNKRSGRMVKAVLPVHIFGNPCKMAQITAIAKKYRLKVVEDATESLGSYFTAAPYKNRFTGAIGDFGVYSFNGNKIITCGGGGALVTNNAGLAQKAGYLANQAKDDPIRYIHHEIGYNFRLTNLQAALGLAQLEKIERFIRIKKKNHALYARCLSGVGGIDFLGIPQGTRPNYWFYSLIVERAKYGMDRMELMRKLAEKQIQARPIWQPIHLQRPYRRNQAYRIEKALWFYQRVLNLPSSSGLKSEEVEKVASHIKGLQKRWKT